MTSPQGPNVGQTPPDTDELSDNPNPWHTGEKLGNVVDVNPSAYAVVSSTAGSDGLAGPPGYFTNPKADPNNPFHGGSGGYTAAERAAAGEVASGYDGALDRNLGHGVGPDATVTQQQISIDAGQNDQLVPPDKRR